MINPLITRIVTSYGHWHDIRRWIFDDNLRQPSVIWIFVNDKPDDPAPPDIKSRIFAIGRLVEVKVNMGRCCARNLAIFQSCSEWIDIIDGDDIPFPITLSLADFPFTQLIYFVARHHTYVDGALIHEENVAWEPPPLNQLFRAIVGNVDVRPVVMLWRRAAICELGGFDGRFDYVEDFNLAIRARLANFQYQCVPFAKASYQRNTPNRPTSPIAYLASLKNWELARSVTPTTFKNQLEEQIRFYRFAFLWSAMNEVNKSNIGLLSKIKECFKWFLGRI